MTSTESANLIPFPSDEEEKSYEKKHSLKTDIAAFDQAVDNAWNLLRGKPFFDWIFYTSSKFGDFSLGWHFLALTRVLTRPNGLRETARLSSSLGIEAVLVNGIIKTIFHRDRPEHNNNSVHSLREPLTSSFPSGHASAAFMAASLLAEKSSNKPLWYGLAGVVSASRLHVKIHHASDVIVGAALGLTLGKIARKLRPLK